MTSASCKHNHNKQLTLNFGKLRKRTSFDGKTDCEDRAKKPKKYESQEKIDSFFSAKKKDESKVNKEEESDVKGKDASTLDIDFNAKLTWQKIIKKDLDLDYTVAFPVAKADEIFQRLEDEIEYLSGKYTQLKVYNKWHQIPRQQSAYGDEELNYAFSGNRIPAKPWTPTLLTLKNYIKHLTNREFNFVLVNRYQDGNDHIGEHKDDERELVEGYPIVSLSLGQSRDFIFRHESTKRKTENVESVPVYTITLQHGSLLFMNPPTNKKWYHSLPIRKRALGVRINLTFRRIINN